MAGPTTAATRVTTCRASVARVQGKGALAGVFVEPVVVASTAGQKCTAMSKQLTNLTVPLGVGSVRIGRGTATVTGTGNHATSTVEVTNVVIHGPGLPTITASLLRATASERGCLAKPQFSASSQVLGLTVGGAPVNVGNTPTTLSLGPLGTLYLNRTLTSPTGLTQRAFELDTVLANVVLAEAQAGFTGPPCP